ncbi:MAG TPA: helix-turn-helix transcriptional regulator [Acetobacteraceae bacterium]|nr:helix-turn-helix transcriptional regulator [Acetobacteraceae bacterium]
MPRNEKKTRQSPCLDGHEGAGKAAFVERLQLILTHWPSADRLARAMGVSSSAFRKWLKGEAEPNRERLIALAAVAGVSIGWLVQGDGPLPVISDHGGGRRHQGAIAESEPTPPSGFVFLPRSPHAAAAGAGTPPAPEESEFIGFRREWVSTRFGIGPDDLFLETAFGESMMPTIRDGDLLLVDTSNRTFRNFGIYVLELNGERLVKRVQRKHDGSLVLISDNTAYQPDSIPGDLARSVNVVGRVVWSGGEI